MIKPQTETAFGVPVWDIYACEKCGALLLPSTEKLHIEFHNVGNIIDTTPKTKDLVCKICDKVITLPLDEDGAMILDDYDDHMEQHERQ